MIMAERGKRLYEGTALQAGRSRVRFPRWYYWNFSLI